MNCTIESLLARNYDGLILTNPQIQILDEISEKIQSFGIRNFNVSRELSSALMKISTDKRGEFAQEWLKDLICELQKEPVLFSHPDLLFHPSLKIDYFALIRQIAHSKQLIVLWPGKYALDILSYAIPDHHHYRIWKISDSLLQQPRIVIYQITDA
ncbi:BREX-3 system P-loop-containing protein BrxF [Flexilinea flocculi]|uniref:BREX-3 system P-loop-containing protein BrxF n=1 Tax=Flexilinea flocculi TaxID=1678840 RepID=A0A0S7BVT7_9CHLR|nr:BREX-3 system P-loop-containing protein BrxF [Flexilinea flocculi]GAP40680.1 hypothetical protein ATC1_13659 [Flexilinea flocculi]